MTRPAIVWLRDDLRLDDQPAILEVAKRPALFVYIFDEETPGPRPMGSASRWWLAHSLEAFRHSLEKLGARLDILQGRSESLLLELARKSEATDVVWNRRYGGPEVEMDKAVKAALSEIGVNAHSFNAHLMREPWEVVTDSGTPFKVYSPFWRRHRAIGPLPTPTPAPDHLQTAPWPRSAPKRVEIADLKLTPSKPDWSVGLGEAWRPGEEAGKKRLDAFIAEALPAYADERDHPAGCTTSRMSPYLRFGEISPRRIAATIEAAGHHGASARAVDKYLSELGWREFSYSLLFHSRDLANRAWNPRFAEFPWLEDESGWLAWTKGQTGYPLVDAGMRELWTTGYMQNRVRLVTASFLIKHLLIDWKRGEKWFWDTLCDGDPADNPANWQWVAGSGADAAPYFRIFNPMLQGVKFDPEGAYVKHWVPELADLDPKYVHAPWLAPESELAGVRLGETYPSPIVEHGFARQRALAALATITA